MPPLFRHGRRFLLYLAAWIWFGVILGVLAPVSGQIRRFEAVAIMVPMMLLLGLVCLAPYYVCRAVPLRAMAWRSLMQHHLVGTILAATGVMLVGKLLAGALS